MQLPAQIDRTVPSEYIDENGHMNIGRYLELGAVGLWERCKNDLGMPAGYVRERQLSNFTAEHHLRYVAEILQGERLSVHVRLVERSDKALHALSLIVNRSREQVACVMETILVHVDMQTRRPTSFPDDVAPLIDAGLALDDVEWPAPLSGAMGVRRRS